MCGITGLIGLNGKKITEISEVRKMMNAIIHRGPDDSGMAAFRVESQASFLDDEIQSGDIWDGVMGFRRLSILDVSKQGHQPMRDFSGNVIICFNGEIYNAFDYKKELLEKGYSFKSKTDTEIVLNLYLQYGIDGLAERINGMYAIVIVDLRIWKIYFLRDRFGIKPLYFVKNENFLLFASETKAFLETSFFRPEVNDASLGEYFAFRSPHGTNLLKGVEQAAPGEYLIISLQNGEMEHRRYFDINNYKRLSENEMSESEAKRLLKNCFQKSICRQLKSDVRLGCQLSGGIDSSLITAFAVKAQKASPLDTFSVIINHLDFSEEKYSDLVCEKLQTNQHKFTLSNDEVIQYFEDVIWHLDSMNNHPNAMGFYWLTKNAADYVKVMLSGEGADELMGGYVQFSMGMYISKYLEVIHGFPWLRNKRFEKKYFGDFECEYSLYAVSRDFDAGIESCSRIIKDTDFGQCIDKRRMMFEQFSGDNFDRHIKYEMSTYLPDLLLKQDKMAMAHSIENRVPFLDYEFTEAAFTIPEKYFICFKPQYAQVYNMRNFVTGKYLLKKIACDEFGKAFAYRQKMGFPLPLRQYLSDKIFKNYINELIVPETQKRGYIDVKQLQDWNNRIDVITNGEVIALWKAVNFEAWCQLFIDKRSKII